MAELNPPSWLQNGCHTAQGDRQVIAGIVCSEGIQSPSYSSIGGELAVTPGEEGLSVSVYYGSAFIQGNDIIGQGYYLVYNDSPTEITLDAADPTDPRLDLIIARVYDSEYGGTEDEWRLESVTGDPSPSPALPDIPLNSIPLAQVRVNPDQTGPIAASQITDLREPYQLCGGNIPPPPQPSAMPLAYRIFGSAGTFTMDMTPYPAHSAVYVEVQGGGGGGGNASVSSAGIPPGSEVAAGGGGGGGAYADAWIPRSALPNSVQITVGAGGSPGNGGGGSGFGTFVSASGGQGGDHSPGATQPRFFAGGGGGTSTDGSHRRKFINGGDGGNGVCSADTEGGTLITAGMGIGGFGGAGGLGGKTSRNSSALNGNGLPGQVYGGGGSGAQAHNSTPGSYTGGTGFRGYVIVSVYGS